MKIVSLTVGTDEILYDLLAERDETKRISGLSSFSIDARYSNIADKVSSFKRVGSQIESLMVLQPDLIIVAAYTNPNFLNKLDELKLPFLKLESFKSISDIKNNINSIAGRIGAMNEAKSIINSLDRIKVIKSSKKKIKIINYNHSGFLMGKDTIFTDLIEKLGFENVITSKGWPKISAEKILTLNPDFIITSGNVGDRKNILDQLNKKSGWRNLTAVKKGQVIIVSGKDLSSTSHYLVKAYEQIKEQYLNYANISK